MRALRVGALLVLAALVLLPALAFAQASAYRRDLTSIAHDVWGLDAPIATLAGQIEQESGWNPRAGSPAGAKGLAQFMDATAAAVARADPRLAVVSPFDPRWSMRAQSVLMRQLVEASTGFDYCERYAKSLASYNQGPAWTKRAEALSPMPQFWFGSVELVNPGKRDSAFRETKDYVRSIILRRQLAYVGVWGLGVCL